MHTCKLGSTNTQVSTAPLSFTLLPVTPHPPQPLHNLTIRDYPPYSKHCYTDQLLPCHPLCPQCHFPHPEACRGASADASPHLKQAFLYENFPTGYKYYFHSTLHSSLCTTVTSSAILCTYPIRL